MPDLKMSSKHFSPAKSLVLSFLLLIIVGMVLLAMPFSAHYHVSILDALFTATSATCVTGLVVFDTGSHWTITGQWIILLLIQFGGLGIMTFSTLGALIIAGRLNLRSRELMEGSLSGRPLPNLGKLIYYIVFGTLFVEFSGAALLFTRFHHDHTVFHAIYLSLFHSISAFCNAGFSLFSDSLVHYQQDAVVNYTIMGLIIVGGIGFWVLYDLVKVMQVRTRKLCLHSRVVLYATATLILVGTLSLLIFEWGNVLSGLPFFYKMTGAMFQSVTARTAGFNTVPIEAMTNSSLLMLVMLMLVGASPGSCGGGIKTTTMAVIGAMIFSRIKNEQQVRIFNRGLPEKVVSKAIGITFFALLILIAAIMILLISEHPGGPHVEGRTLFLEVVFEAFSALGTVGLSMGLTPVLSFTGKIVIIFLMFVGRVGPLTIALAIAGRQNLRIRLAEEELWVG